jgi:hypothetical protein
MCAAGIHPRHIESARLRSETVGSWKAASSQKQRYEVGRMSAAKEFFGTMLRTRSRASFEQALFLATPPFAVGALSLIVGVALAALAGAWALAAVLGVLLAVLVGSLVVALLQSRATLRTWLSLLAAPWYLPWKLVVQLRAVTRLRHAASVDVPTARR